MTQTSQSNQTKCAARHPKSGESICSRDIWDEDETRCIFHANKKELREFTVKFEEELRRIRNDSDLDELNARGFVFPASFSFKDLEFEKRLNFEFAKFGSNVSFAKSKFADRVSFRNAEFGKHVSFWAAEFGEAIFQRARFDRSVFFIETVFHGKANFAEAEFKEWASFRRTVFIDDAVFAVASFGDNCYFWQTKFNKGATFHKSEFKAKAFFHKLETQSIVSFTSVFIEKPGGVLFDDLDMKNILLRQTQVENIEFLGCTWPKSERRHLVADEFFRNNVDLTKVATLSELKQLYLRLQQNLENRKRHEEASDFYIGAMEARRKELANETKYVWWRWLRQNILSLIPWYRYVSLYGERYLRCLIWMFGLVILFPGLYLLFGFDYPSSDPPISNGKYQKIGYRFVLTLSLPTQEDYMKALDVSVRSFTFQRITPYRLTLASQRVAIIESAVSAVFLALFLLAIRRRFRR